MSIEFEDGSRLATDDWSKIMSIVKQRAKDGKPKPVEIKQSGVTVKLDSYEKKSKSKSESKSKSGPEYSNYVETTYLNWKVRVWRKEEEAVYGCNYYKGEDIRYIEVRFGDVRDENGVFKYVSSIIDDI